MRQGLPVVSLASDLPPFLSRTTTQCAPGRHGIDLGLQCSAVQVAPCGRAPRPTHERWRVGSPERGRSAATSRCRCGWRAHGQRSARRRLGSQHGTFVPLRGRRDARRGLWRRHLAVYRGRGPWRTPGVPLILFFLLILCALCVCIVRRRQRRRRRRRQQQRGGGSLWYRHAEAYSNDPCEGSGTVRSSPRPRDAGLALSLQRHRIHAHPLRR